MTREEMNEIKQFISSTMTDHFALFRVELRSDWRKDIDAAVKMLSASFDNLEAKVDSNASFLMQALENYHEDHEQRIRALETVRS